MKTDKKTTKSSTVEDLRKIRDKIGLEIKDLSKDELLKYFKKESTIFPEKVWQKEK